MIKEQQKHTKHWWMLSQLNKIILYYTRLNLYTDVPLKLGRDNELRLILTVSLSHELRPSNHHLRTCLSVWHLNQQWLLLQLCVFLNSIYWLGWLLAHACFFVCTHHFPKVSQCSACFNKIILLPPITWQHLSFRIIRRAGMFNRRKWGVGLGCRASFPTW